jgi:hypothetical protein
VRKLAAFDLDALYPIPQTHSRDALSASFERRMTLLSYAAYRRRHEVVKHLLVAGASPTVSERQPTGAISSEADDTRLRELLTRRFGAGMASAAAAYAVEVIVQMRNSAARDVALGAVLPPCSACDEAGGEASGEAGYSTVCFDPCGCACCEGCVWSVLLKGNGDGDLRCPCCGSRPPLRGNDGPLQRDDANVEAAQRTEEVGDSTTTPTDLPEWTCECCAYMSVGARPCCRNCSAPRPPPTRPPPPSFCADLATSIKAFRSSSTAAAAAAASAAAASAAAASAAARTDPSRLEVAARPDGLEREAEAAGVATAALGAAPAAGAVQDVVGGARDEESVLGAAPCQTGAVPAASDARVIVGDGVRVCVEMMVGSRRSFGQKLTFLVGSAPLDIRLAPAEGDAATEGEPAEGGAASSLPPEPPLELQLVLDGRQLRAAAHTSEASHPMPADAMSDAMVDEPGGAPGGASGSGPPQPGDQPEEAQLVMRHAGRGDRVRAAGTLHAVATTTAGLGGSSGSGGSDGSTRWELRAESALLLRPLDVGALQERTRTRPSAGAKENGAGRPSKTSSKRAKGGARRARAAAAAAAEGGAPDEAGLGVDDRGMEEARARRMPSKFRALPPREAALATLRTLSWAQRRDVASAAAADGDLAMIDALLSLGFDLAVPLDDYGQTATFLAAANGHLPVLRRLLERGFSPDCPAHGGTTASCAAAARGHYEALALLCEGGADVGAIGSAGVSPLGWILRAVGSLPEVPRLTANEAREALKRLAKLERTAADSTLAADGGGLQPVSSSFGGEATRGLAWYQRRGLNAGARAIIPAELRAMVAVAAPVAGNASSQGVVRGGRQADGGGGDDDDDEPAALGVLGVAPQTWWQQADGTWSNAVIGSATAHGLRHEARPPPALALSPHGCPRCVAGAAPDARECGPSMTRLVRLIDHAADHPGAGACFIDGGIPESVLAALEGLFRSLPLAERNRGSQGLNDRSYFADNEGWVTEALKGAVMAAGGGAPCEGEVMAAMRFLSYFEAGGGLPPHVDLSRTRRDGRTSLCTFILYLTDCEAGGETVLLQRLAQPSRILAAVTPRRGRLLLFPHTCPHMAAAVVAEGLPKVLLRGEML